MDLNTQYTFMYCKLPQDFQTINRFASAEILLTSLFSLLGDTYLNSVNKVARLTKIWISEGSFFTSVNASVQFKSSLILCFLFLILSSLILCYGCCSSESFCHDMVLWLSCTTTTTTTTTPCLSKNHCTFALLLLPCSKVLL